MESRTVLWNNVRALWGEKPEAAYVKAGISAGQAHRLLTSPGQNVKLEGLDAVAAALKRPAWALLYPDMPTEGTLKVYSEEWIEAEINRRAEERAIEIVREGARLREKPKKTGRDERSNSKPGGARKNAGSNATSDARKPAGPRKPVARKT